MINFLWHWSKGWNSIKVPIWHQTARIKDLLHFCKEILLPCSSRIAWRGLKPEKDVDLWSWDVKWIGLSWPLGWLKDYNCHKVPFLRTVCLSISVHPSWGQGEWRLIWASLKEKSWVWGPFQKVCPISGCFFWEYKWTYDAAFVLWPRQRASPQTQSHPHPWPR